MEKRTELEKKIPRRITASFLLAYLVMLAIVLIAFFIFLFTASRTVNKEARHLAQVQISGVERELQERLNQYGQLCNTLAAESWLSRYAGLSNSASDTAAMMAEEGRNNISHLVGLYGADINTAAVYFPKSSSLISATRGYTASHLSWFFDDYEGMSPERLEESGQNSVWQNYYGEDYYWIIRSVYREDRIIAYILVDYNLPGIINRLSSEGELILVGTEDRCVYTDGAPVQDADYRHILESIRQDGRFQMDGAEYEAAGSHSSFGGLLVCIGIPVSHSLTGTRILLRGVFLLLLCGAVTLLVLQLYLRQQVLTPLEELIRVGAAGEPVRSFKSLVRSAGDQFSILNRKEAASRAELEKTKPLVLGRLLARLEFPAEKQGEDWAAHCFEELGIPPESGVCLLGIRMAEDPDGFFSEPGLDIRADKRLSIFWFLLDNVLRDLLPGRNLILAPLGEFHVLFMEWDEAQGTEPIREAATTLSAFYTQQFGTVLSISQPHFAAGSPELGDAVRAVMSEMRYSQFWEGAERPPEVLDGGFSAYTQGIRVLLNCLNVSDYKGASDAVEELLDHAIPRDAESLSVAKYRIYGLASILSAALRDRSDSSPEGGKADFEQRLDSAELETVEGFRREAQAILEELLEASRRQGPNTDIIRRIGDIRQYIDTHYADNSLGIASLSLKFQISESYLSRSFKHYVRTTVLDYITRVRVNEAKKLLPEDSIKSIAQRVGFWDTQGLVRAFKKVEGITPSEYKAMVEKGGVWK